MSQLDGDPEPFLDARRSFIDKSVCQASGIVNAHGEKFLGLTTIEREGNIIAKQVLS